MKLTRLHLAVAALSAITFALLAALWLYSWRLESELRDLRNERRSFDVHDIFSAAGRDLAAGGRQLTASQEAPAIVHPTFSQVIVSDSSGIVCSDQARRPSCPGQILDYSGRDAKCVADFGALFGPAGLVPEDPSTISRMPANKSLPIGPKNSGYYIHITAGNRLEIGACWPEDQTEIRLKR